MFDPKDPKLYRDAIERYRRAQPDFELLSTHVQERMRAIARRLGVYPIVRGRAKSLESFAEKIQRPGKNYRDDPLVEATDLCGVRVILHFLDEVQAFAEEVRKEFQIDPENSGDARERLALNAFGYLSNHLIIQLREKPSVAGEPEERLERLRTLKCELQIRTLGQHIWADIYHELGYKNEFQLPGRWRREFARVAAALESCDKVFQEVKDAMRTYECSYGAYMTGEQLGALARRMEILLEVDSGNVKTVHRLMRAYLSLEGSDEKIKQILARYADAVRQYPPAARDFGVAYTTVSPPSSEEFRKGQSLLQQAARSDPRDVDTLCSLGGSYRKQGNSAAALDCYRGAHRIDRTNPYPLSNYIAEELLRAGNAGGIPVFETLIQGALERCARQLEVKINFPWVFFDLGIFHLYLGGATPGSDHVEEAVRFYAKGIETAPRAWMIRSARKTIRQFIDRHIALDGLDRIDMLLRLGHWLKSGEPAERPAPSPVAFRPPVVVIAGGCAGLQASQSEQLPVLRKALLSFEGTLVSGGTRSGIAVIPGDIQDQVPAGRVLAVGYVPSRETEGLSELLDVRNKLRHTSGVSFSILEPLTFWEDLLACGGVPPAVRVLGFNGGAIAACEYRIALAFGAQVGVVRGSGGEADKLLADPLWQDSANLHALEPTASAIAEFVRPV